LALALATAAFLAACGEGGSSETGPAASTGASEASSGEKLPPDRGEISAQSARFQKYSQNGKLHLAEFGDEASSARRREAEGVLVSYFEATRREAWPKACTYLSAVTTAQFEAAKQTSDQSCGKTLAQLAKSELGKKGKSDSPIYASRGIASLRIEEGGLAGAGAGFALFHGSDGKDHWMAMKVEDGAWKIISALPQPFL
jgi:hypothetical protein